MISTLLIIVDDMALDTKLNFCYLINQIYKGQNSIFSICIEIILRLRSIIR